MMAHICVFNTNDFFFSFEKKNTPDTNTLVLNLLFYVIQEFALNSGREKDI